MDYYLKFIDILTQPSATTKAINTPEITAMLEQWNKEYKEQNDHNLP